MSKTYKLSSGPSRAYGVMYDDGRDMGKVVQNVVADGAIKWSAYDNLGQRLLGSYLTMEEAVRAVESTR